MAAKTATVATVPAVSLDRKLSKSALANLVELAREGATPNARSYWAGVLAREVNFTAR